MTEDEVRQEAKRISSSYLVERAFQAGQRMPEPLSFRDLAWHDKSDEIFRKLMEKATYLLCRYNCLESMPYEEFRHDANEIFRDYE